MKKFVQVDGGDRGRPRTNKGNKKGNVRITVSMPGVEGNITRTLSIQEATVTEVFTAIQDTLVKQTA